MDRRNGGDPLAPPRPPKLLPRVHRPRAPEPPIMNTPSMPINQPQQQQQEIWSNRNNLNINNNSVNSSSRLSNSTSSNINNNSNLNNNTSSNKSSLKTPLLQARYQHQQQLQPQQQQHSHTTTSLSRNNSNISSASSTTSVATTVSSVNSFTRRRPPPLPAVPIQSQSSTILPLLGANLNQNSINNNINFNSIEPAPVSPVTLAAPRPESERLTNEYVDTPFRTVLPLHLLSRNVHPAGQHNHGQTTTQHNLLLLQQNQRHQQQHQNQSQHHTSHHQSSGNHNSGRGGNVGTSISGDPATTTKHSSSHTIKSGDTVANSRPPTRASGDTGTQTTTTSSTLATSPISNIRLQHHRPNALPITQPITKQPPSATFAKDISAFHEDALDLHHIGGGTTGTGIETGSMGTPIGGFILGESALNPITCPRCDRCRCEQCQSPRQLPQTWVCNKTCLCSAETIIDYASCLCCVKALFYHCAKDHEMDCEDGATTLCVDDPCSCLPHKRAQRWSWLGVLSLVLPCLWCYWPMRGCVAICEKCYARHAGHGCRCQTIGSTSSILPIVNIAVPSANDRNTNSSTGKANAVGGINGSGHHHHHHGPNSGGSDNIGDSTAARILRKCDITPEKRLLDSSPEC